MPLALPQAFAAASAARLEAIASSHSPSRVKMCDGICCAWAESGAIAAYRVYRRTAPGVWRPLATVTPTAFDPAFPGKVVLLDFAGTFPGGGAAGGDEDASGLRHYVVAALGNAGVEGPWSAEVTAAPP